MKFKNESGVTCYVEIRGYSNPEHNVLSNVEKWDKNLSFPAVLKTQIPVGKERSITVKDVVVSGKNSHKTRMYFPTFGIRAFGDDFAHYEKSKLFSSSSTTQYAEGTFHIKLKKNFAGKDTFGIDFIN